MEKDNKLKEVMNVVYANMKSLKDTFSKVNFLKTPIVSPQHISERNKWKRHKDIMKYQQDILKIQENMLEQQRSTSRMTLWILVLTICSILITIMLTLLRE